MPNSPSWDDVVKSVNDTKLSSTNKTQTHDTSTCGTDHDEIRDLINQLSPDSGSHIPNVVGVYIYQQRGNDGFTIFDDWYKNDSSYPGTEKAQDDYASYSEMQHPVDKATILKLIDESATAATNDIDEIPKSISTIKTADKPAKPKTPTIFDKHSLTGKSHILEQQQLDKVYVLDKLALAGQSTIFFAPPNTGKTLLILRSLFDSIQDSRIDASDAYYIDHDDSHDSLLEKLHLFEELGCHILADGYEKLRAGDFTKQTDLMCKQDQARGKVFVLDTLKKFVDPMNKRQCTEWGRSMRRLTAKGATVISLAHTNKKFDSDGWPIHAGVSDLVDDSDAAYLMRIADKDEAALVATVELKNIKRRGDIVDSIAFSFSYDPKISYPERLASVEQVDDARLEKIKLADSIKADDELITIAIKCIEDGFTTKMILRDEISKRTGISKRKSVQLIEKYEGTGPSKHKWTFTTQEHGRKVYSLLKGDTDAE